MKKKLNPTMSTAMPVSLDPNESTHAPGKKNGQKKTNSKGLNGKPGIKNGKDPGLSVHDTYYSPELDNKALLHVLLQVKEGNFAVRLPDDKNWIEWEDL
jgi:hypothetical protein